MPRLPRLSGQELVRALERLGFATLRQKGSHLVLRRGHATCVVPLHRELKVGTLSAILHQAEVTAAELIEALK